MHRNNFGADQQCAMCHNSAAACPANVCFYSFPKDFNLCMRWVESCGNPVYSEDFAYQGALPFINRIVCSDHFSFDSFVDPNDFFKGLKQDVVPIVNFTESKLTSLEDTPCDIKDNLPSFPPTSADLPEGNAELKEEPSDYNDASVFEFNGRPEPLDERIATMNVKREPPEYAFPDVASLQTWTEVPYNELMTVRNDDDEKKKHLTDMKRMESYLDSAEKVACESEDERKSRLYQNAVRTALRRSMESEQQSLERRRKNALRAAERRNTETPEKRALRLEKDRVRTAGRRLRETEMETSIRRYNDAVRAAFRRSKEPAETRKARQFADMLRAAKRRTNETPEQRARRHRADKERMQKRRLTQRFNLAEDDLSLLGELQALLSDGSVVCSEISSGQVELSLEEEMRE